ncbi:BRO-N domain-containing protein [Parabacteroides merdae]|uniref:BRO-N domain-containing protein n=1 Tax=Parabacteroides merdae TaxID=46503 RepID=UPI0018A06FDE|nr:BRO family protein [Parabacteroides merdae]
METNLNLFYNEEANVTIRTRVINNAAWFVAKDVARALDITWSGATLANIPEDWKGMLKLNIPSSGDRGGGTQQLSVINEAALYKLAFRSNKPQADAFVNWVAGEVLPSIRQTGQYRIKGEAECMREQQQRQRLPLPKYRPFFEEWKQRVKPYISRNELAEVAEGIGVSYPHVRKVYAGTSVSKDVVRRITSLAKQNRSQGITYPDPVPICEQMCIEWDEEKS